MILTVVTSLATKKALLDERQLDVCNRVPKGHWLSNKDRLEKFYEWNTFFRRNINRFVETYFEIQLYPYQHQSLYYMNTSDVYTKIASRATAKSFEVAAFISGYAVLYPRSKILIVSGTKDQSKLIVTEKLQNELMPLSPNLTREIEYIKDNANITYVKFKNGSSIKVVPALESSRGNRSTIIIYEEFRMIEKFIIDSVINPTKMIRPVPFLKDSFYKDLAKELQEEAKDIYISSAWYNSHWMGEHIKQEIKLSAIPNSGHVLLANDMSVSLYHGIKSFKDLRNAKEKFDPMTWKMEYENKMISENTNAYFSYEMFTHNQTLTRCFYPRSNEDVRTGKKNQFAIPKQTDEIRIISCDMAFVGGKNNDNSVFSCIRLIPESKKYTTSTENGYESATKQVYKRQLMYLEAFQKRETTAQAVRIKQLFEDFEADYCVLDMRNGGILVYDTLAKFLYDQEREKEYEPWTCMNDEKTANRIKMPSAKPVLFAIHASAKLNSDIATVMRANLIEDNFEMLIGYKEAIDEILSKNIAYREAVKSGDTEKQLFYERPFLETHAFIAESVELLYKKDPQTGIITISEQGANMKDRYTSVSYGNYFASLIEQNLVSEGGDYDYVLDCY